MNYYYIGIDDTDNKTSRGTGFRGRELASLLVNTGLATVLGVTRHQLLFHPDVPYTSHNSSACISVVAEDFLKLKDFCKKYLIRIAADGSDIALCIIDAQNIPESVIKWGEKCKIEVVKQGDARQIAWDENIYLEGFTGSQDGVIGALAAVGLHAQGNDGRYIWVGGKELRDYPEIVIVEELMNSSGIHEVISKDGVKAKTKDSIYTGGWMRPVRKEGKIKLIVNHIPKNENYEWTVADKDYIKSISN